MSIKSQTPGVRSDRPLLARDRKPIYQGANKLISPEISRKDNLSEYVKDNLKQVDKSRSKEYR